MNDNKIISIYPSSTGNVYTLEQYLIFSSLTPNLARYFPANSAGFIPKEVARRFFQPQIKMLLPTMLKSAALSNSFLVSTFQITTNSIRAIAVAAF
jgi:hypothetical protein